MEIFESTRYPYPGSDHKKYQRDFVPLLPVEQAEIIAKPVDEQLASLEAELLPLAEELLIFENAVGGIVSESEAAKVKMHGINDLSWVTCKSFSLPGARTLIDQDHRTTTKLTGRPPIGPPLAFHRYRTLRSSVW